MILILSADFEEQFVCTLYSCDRSDIIFRSVMALTRGNQGKRPCPICYIPLEELADMHASFTLRTVEETKEIIYDARKLNVTDRNAVLSEKGLRDVDVSSVT
jgi:hypothetical protein